jgi:serine/threonine protein kinase
VHFELWVYILRTVLYCIKLTVPKYKVLLEHESKRCFHPKLADFGVARIVKDQDRCQTFTGSMVYLAPEVLDVADHGKYSFEVDMWGK